MKCQLFLRRLFGGALFLVSFNYLGIYTLGANYNIEIDPADYGKISICLVGMVVGFMIYRGNFPFSSRNEKASSGAKEGGVFISYRRSDSSDATGRIYDRLVAQYKAEKVFKDVDNIPLGVNFKDYLSEQIARCSVVLVVIGPDWKGNSGEENRLEDPADFVRVEVESALEQNIPIIPVLVRNASMPQEMDLPASMRPLVYLNGQQVRPDPDFHNDMNRLTRGIEKYF